MPQTETTIPPAAAPQALDLIDRKIIAALMQDATIPIARIADRVGLSQTPCWKRIQKLEASGVILRRVALADPVKLGFGLTVFVGIAAPDHTTDWRAAFTRALARLPEVIEAWRMAGDVDYLLRVAVPDMAGYDRFYTALTDAVPIRTLTAQFAMESLRDGTAYPVNTTDR